jgi:amidase
VLVIDRHLLCPTEVAVSAALDRLAERLAGCRVARGGPNLPDLAQTSRIYSELLSAFFSADLPAAVSEQVAATVRALSLGDESLAAAGLRGLTMSHPDWIRASRIRNGLRARWQALFREVDVVPCPPMPTVAFPHDHSPQFARILDVDGANPTSPIRPCVRQFSQSK